MKTAHFSATSSNLDLLQRCGSAAPAQPWVPSAIPAELPGMGRDAGSEPCQGLPVTQPAVTLLSQPGSTSDGKGDAGSGAACTRAPVSVRCESPSIPFDTKISISGNEAFFFTLKILQIFYSFIC